MTHSYASGAAEQQQAFSDQAAIIKCTCCLLIYRNQEVNDLFTSRVNHITLHFLCLFKLKRETFTKTWKERGGERTKSNLASSSVESSAWSKQAFLCEHTYIHKQPLGCSGHFFGVVTMRGGGTQHTTGSCFDKNREPLNTNTVQHCRAKFICKTFPVFCVAAGLLFKTLITPEGAWEFALLF